MIAVLKVAVFISLFFDNRPILPNKSNNADRNPKASPKEVIAGNREVISILFHTYQVCR